MRTGCEVIMTNEEILFTAMEQSAIDCNCAQEDFQAKENVVVPFRLCEKTRKYISEPTSGMLVSYGSNVVASVTDGVRDAVSEYIRTHDFYHCFETPCIYWLNDRLGKSGQKVCFMAEYYLPAVEKLSRRCCDYEMRILGQRDFEPLYLPEWSNALCASRKQLDVLGIGAYDGGKLIGLAGCSADCENMWQIGVDVLPEYRRMGIASALTGNLALEILERGKVPFYCSAWSNIRSVRNAVKSGFIPTWVEISLKPVSVTSEAAES